MLESLFNKVAGLQDCCKTYLLHAHLRYYFSLGKTLKFYLFSQKYFLTDVWMGSKYASGSLDVPCEIAPLNSFIFQYL